MIKNVMNLRSTKKNWVVYGAGLLTFCTLGLIFKNFNDKMTVMGDSVVSYQMMIDKQTGHLRSLEQENARYKRDLKEEKEINAGTLKEMEARLRSLQDDCRAETGRLESDMESLQDQHNQISEEKRKIDQKYKTLSKANNNAIAEIENYKADNKKLRGQLHEATTSKSSEMIQLKEKLATISSERDKYADQYSALFKQHQQSEDNIQMLQSERDRLQDQIREIQKLSVGRGGAEQSSQSSELVQVQPDSAKLVSPSSSSSTARAMSPVNQVVEEPAGAPLSSSSTSSSLVVGAQVLAAQPPPPAENPRFARQQQQQQQQQAQYIQPLQPQQLQQPEEDDNEEVDYEFDSLNAPYQRQLDFSPVAQQAWPARAHSQQVQQVQQVVPQVAKYGLEQSLGGGIVQHGDHYHVQQPQQRPQQRQYRPAESYQARGSWQNYQQNEIQDFYRQRGGLGGHVLKDF